MARRYVIVTLALALSFVHAAARNLPSDVSYHVNEQTSDRASAPKEIVLHADAPKAESPAGEGLKDKKNFIYGGVGGFAGVGGYAGVAGGVPLLGGLGGIGKFGGIGAAGGIGGYSGVGGAGGVGGGVGGAGGLGGIGGLGGFPGGGAGGPGGGNLPFP